MEQCVVAVTHLERSVLSLRDEYPDNEGLDRAPDDKYNVELPPDLLQGNRVSELVDQHGGCKRQVRESHALGAHFEGQYFDRVQSLDRGDTEGENGIEEEYEGDEGVTGRVCMGLRLFGHGHSGGNPDKGDANEGANEHRTATKPVHEEGTNDSLRTVSTR